MNKIVIGGISDSTEFVVGFGLLNLARKKYPLCFLCEFEDMLENQYWRWLKRINRENGWKHDCNFIAWYEYMYGGPKSLIGDFNLFVEFMSEEYNVRLAVSPMKLTRLAAEFAKVKAEKLIAEAENLANVDVRRVAIIYENHPGVGLLCREILNHQFIPGPNGIELTLYNFCPLSENRTTLHDDLVSLPAENSGFRRVKLAKNLKHALKNCELLIFMGNDREQQSDLMDDLKGEAVFWARMGQLVSKYSWNPEALRVVFTCMNYPCFNATFFIRHASNVRPDLVVAVTHHVALQPLAYVSKASGIPLSNMMQQTAHVWGSPGISQLVDLGNTDVLYNIPKMPMSRFELENALAKEINWDGGNPFENGNFEDDFTWRKLDYIVGSNGWTGGLKYTWFYVGQTKARIIEMQQRQPYVTTIRATIDILSAWYDNFVMKTPLTVGVYVSKSIHGIPEGIVFSMPALMRKDDRRGWYPFKWCDVCRETFNMDHRPRWTFEPDPLNDPSPDCRTCEASVCKRIMCSERKVSKRTCRHHRNPDIFWPQDPLLSLTGVVITVVKIFLEVKSHIDNLIRLAGQKNAEEKENNELKVASSKKIRVSFVGDTLGEATASNRSHLQTVRSHQHSLHLVGSDIKERRRSLTFVVKRKRPTRGFIDVKAEATRRQLEEEERKWEKFLDEPIEPKDVMKYMACPVPTELTGIISGAVRMSDLDKQVEKMIKEKHKLMAEEQPEAIPEEVSEEHTASDTEQLQSAVTEASRHAFEEEEATNEELTEEPAVEALPQRTKVTREERENLEEELRLQKLLDAISIDDVPIYKMMRFVFPESPNIPEDPNDPYWYLKNKDYVKHVMKTLSKTGYQDSLGVTYRREFDANRLAEIEHYWNHVVPRQCGHIYFTAKELQKAEKAQNNRINLISKLLPDKFVDFQDVKVPTFVPPTREMGENDVSYDIRTACLLRKFKDDVLKEFMNRSPQSVRIESGVWAVVGDQNPKEQDSTDCSTNQFPESAIGDSSSLVK